MMMIMIPSTINTILITLIVVVIGSINKKKAMITIKLIKWIS